MNNLSEEEKKAVEYWKRDIELYHYNTQLASEHYAQIILNLIENQQKELNNLKEIEQLHKEENGKLRVELEQEKEKNKELEKYKTYYEEMEEVNKKFIAVDKIKEKIKEYEEMVEGTFKDLTFCGQNRRDICYEIIKVLKELLESDT